jgi:pyruvate formate lyase activating enzyme
MALDPIEKKPLARFMPGSRILSVGSYGCNLRCPFCQNHSISMVSEDGTETVYMPPEKLVQKALELVSRGNIGIAYTYNEPFISFEYIMDCAKLAHLNNLKNVLVTNGYVCEGPLKELLQYTDAMNIDLKGFTESFYKKLHGDLETVKKNIAIASKSCHVEVTALIIPDENDSVEEMEALSLWLSEIDSEIPLHISRFFPRYKYGDKAATPVETIYRLAEAAGSNLKYVYTGNC